MATDRYRTLYGVFSSNDASTGAESTHRFSLFDMRAHTTLTVTTNDWVILHDVLPSDHGMGITASLFDGGDTAIDAGELIAGWVGSTLTGQPGGQVIFAAGHWCAQGTWPKIVTSSSVQIDVTARGVIYTQPTS